MKDTANRPDLWKKMMRMTALVIIWFSLCGGLVQKCSFEKASAPNPLNIGSRQDKSVLGSVQGAEEAAESAKQFASQCTGVTPRQLEAARSAYAMWISTGTDIETVRDYARNAALKAGADHDGAVAAIYAAETDYYARLAQQAKKDYDDAKTRRDEYSNNLDSLNDSHSGMRTAMPDINNEKDYLEEHTKIFKEKWLNSDRSLASDFIRGHMKKQLEHMQTLAEAANRGAENAEKAAAKAETEGYINAAALRAAATAAQRAADTAQSAVDEVKRLLEAAWENCQDVNCVKRRGREAAAQMDRIIQAAEQGHGALDETKTKLEPILDALEDRVKNAENERTGAMHKAAEYHQKAEQAANRVNEIACGEKRPLMPSESTYNQDIYGTQGTSEPSYVPPPE